MAAAQLCEVNFFQFFSFIENLLQNNQMRCSKILLNANVWKKTRNLQNSPEVSFQKLTKCSQEMDVLKSDSDEKV